MPLERQLEPEVMDTALEAEEYDAIDHAVVNERFVVDFCAGATNLVEGELLDLGAGTARIPVVLCRLRPGVKVLAVDLAESMLAVGREHVRRENLQESIRLECVDAKRLPYKDGQFSAVISNSLVHHVPEPMTVFREAARVLKPGGVLFFRDLVRPGTEEQLTELVHRYATEGTVRQRAMFADSLRAALTLDEVRAGVASLGFDPQTVQLTSDRHWTWHAIKAR